LKFVQLNLSYLVNTFLFAKPNMGPNKPKDRGVEELRGDPKVEATPQGLDQRSKKGSSAKDGAPERLRYGTIQKKVG